MNDPQKVHFPLLIKYLFSFLSQILVLKEFVLKILKLELCLFETCFYLKEIGAFFVAKLERFVFGSMNDSNLMGTS
jgi:hypothetical protein